ncbi:hypothetical protein [Mesorhizobium tamadayense]|nr:hypothetical protein [Mesorhizobium tamadayense]
MANMRVPEAIELMKLWAALSPENQALVLAELRHLDAERERRKARAD